MEYWLVHAAVSTVLKACIRAAKQLTDSNAAGKLNIEHASALFELLEQTVRPLACLQKDALSQHAGSLLHGNRAVLAAGKEGTCGALSTTMESTTKSEYKFPPLHRYAGSLAPDNVQGSSCEGVVLFTCQVWIAKQMGSPPAARLASAPRRWNRRRRRSRRYRGCQRRSPVAHPLANAPPSPSPATTANLKKDGCTHEPVQDAPALCSTKLACLKACTHRPIWTRILIFKGASKLVRKGI